MTFLGILINSLEMTLEITEDRREELKHLLQEWLSKKSTTLKEIQSLLGKLSFVCSTVRSGRIFLSRIIQQISNMPVRGRKRLTKDFRMDVSWWCSFMDKFNGKSMIPTDWSHPDEVFSRDALLKMCGGWLKPDFFKAHFPEHYKKVQNIHINEFELLAILVALRVWSSRIKNQNLLAYSDNQCTVEIINTGKAKNKFAQRCLWEIVWILASNNACLKLVHISSECNRIPDILSCWWEGQEQQQRYQVFTAGIKTVETLIEPELFNIWHKW